MDINNNDQKGSGSVWPEKFYTQNEVDDLLKKNEYETPSRARQIEEERHTADKRKRFENKIVAGLVKKSNRILVSISSRAFPIDIFPNTINVEEGRITIINRHFLSSVIHSVDIKHISNIFINRTFLFSQLVITSKTFENNEVKIKNLRTKEAIYARRIIEGLRVLVNKQIDTSNYTKKELLAKLEALSTTEIVT